MKYLRNINPFEPIKMKDMVNHSGNKIASKALVDNDKHEVRFFSFAKGESIDKEYYEMESLFIVIEGEAKVVYKENSEAVIKEGEIFALEADIQYGIEAVSDVKLLNILIRG
ncbi:MULTISPECIES: hypothetical protein [Clostridium]|uniref:Cupin 2 conserved barrel domain-containing protein n=2 Tax=Clostridium TaxID=1485 RepID=M1LZ30_9CLOT|nr:MULTISPECIES: hypothetical protein [Clostridium]AGF58555.1 cupin 2 conserved barrel domain-containing protein [Clostridium saccharoperbutylacetonicum N1-4(HMT)]MBC2478581.1 cupin [Clostridium beijerinckii]NRT60667.1 quercetin dioxygenase-like cupin family protein [Clostridium saccharoperbutylacetonicum]NSB23981.1 quercetin dioxygenase-like cupin family protein [Clostridium saccharoperbutylacetonicum]NSB43357.1 quercetin dioxygenase-like cupin family protein [Clostridium saccharoperbutylacet